MKLKVGRADIRRYYPDIGNNLDVPESERWCIVLRKPPKFRMATIGFTTEVRGGVAHQNFDQRAYYEEFIVRHENAPDLDIEGKVRKLRAADLFEFDSLIPVIDGIAEIIAELIRAADKEEQDTKN
ncbi:unnamed protein product [marine sediment metagenome]|uniref:Uncharacterized protein n=1 Tax=marine sediment metagenome TaxID=412755 RepID=X0SCV2_9ZZZZ